MLNWGILTISYTRGCTDEVIETTTDNPCHLTLYWTLNKPLRHKGTLVLRGMPLPWGASFCLNALNEIEQEEPGDTIAHTFIVPDWPHCQTRYFVMAGTVEGIESPSVSAIYERHHRARCTIIVEATKDTWLDKANPNLNRGLETYMSVSGNYTHALLWHVSLLSFDIPAVPEGATILSIWLYLHYIMTGAPGATHSAGKLLYGDWVETEATFNQRKIGVPWSMGAFSTSDYTLIDPDCGKSIIGSYPGANMYFWMYDIYKDALKHPGLGINLAVVQDPPATKTTWYRTREYLYYSYWPQLLIEYEQ